MLVVLNGLTIGQIQLKINILLVVSRPVGKHLAVRNEFERKIRYENDQVRRREIYFRRRLRRKICRKNRHKIRRDVRRKIRFKSGEKSVAKSVENSAPKSVEKSAEKKFPSDVRSTA